MSNRSDGAGFEEEFSAALSRAGFWAHLLTQNKSGQPADVIAARNGVAHLIDCKRCSTKKGFDLSRMEENQVLAMQKWYRCGNGFGWFALQLPDESVYMLSDHTLSKYHFGSSIPCDKIREIGERLESWVQSVK